MDGNGNGREAKRAFAATRPARWVLWTLTALVALIGIANALMTVAAGTAPYNASGLLGRFALDTEGSLAAWYSACLLFLGALFLAANALQEPDRGQKRHWALLGVVFFLISMDEIIHLHEELGQLFKSFDQISHVFYFGWVVAGIGFVAVVGLWSLPFLFRLPSGTRIRILVAGTVYVGGALGMEMLSGVLSAEHAPLWATTGEVVLEECGEMLGATLFIVALLRHLCDVAPDLVLRASGQPSTSLSHAA